MEKSESLDLKTEDSVQPDKTYDFVPVRCDWCYLVTKNIGSILEFLQSYGTVTLESINRFRLLDINVQCK